MLYHAHEMTVNLPDGQVTCAVFGNGQKCLIILPGLSLRPVQGSAAMLAMRYRIFCKDYKVYVIDRKDPTPEGSTISTLADDVAKTMQQIGLRQADVIGISEGGMIAQYLTLNYPELVHKLVLGVTTSRMNDTVRGVLERCIRSGEKGDYLAVLEDMMENMYSRQYVEKYSWFLPMLLKLVKTIEPERFVRLAKAGLTCDAYDQLQQIRCPVLVIGGRQDRIVSGEASEEIAAKLGCQLYMYEELGHSAYEEGSDFNQRIYDFLQQNKKTVHPRRE